MLQRPFKYGFRQEFDNYTSIDIDKQLDNKEAKDIKVDTKMSTLKPFLCGWLLKAWGDVNKAQMIKVGWSRCGLQQAFQQAFQVSAMDEHMKTPLFQDDLLAIEEEQNDKEGDIDTNQTIQDVMQDSLKIVADIASSSRTSSLFKNKSSKRYVPGQRKFHFVKIFLATCFGRKK